MFQNHEPSCALINEKDVKTIKKSFQECILAKNYNVKKNSSSFIPNPNAPEITKFLVIIKLSSL